MKSATKLDKGGAIVCRALSVSCVRHLRLVDHHRGLAGVRSVVHTFRESRRGGASVTNPAGRRIVRQRTR